MRSSRLHSLTERKKWQLAVGIVLVYLPIRIYVSNVQIDLAMVQTKAPFWTIEFFVNVAFFRLWITIVEKIGNFFDWIDGRLTVQLPARLIAFGLGVCLAILFNFAFFFLWIGMAQFFKANYDVTITRTQFERDPYARAQRTKANTGLTVMAMLATFYLVSNRRNMLKVQQLVLDGEQLEKENLRTQLLVLKNQVNPHFLFNNFSILTSLIESDSQKSIVFLNRLSQSYRYILSQPDCETISLQAELNFIDTYIFLLKARFEEKIRLKIDISETYRERYQIAPLTLQLLIENAVKHNRMSDEEPLIISIMAESDYLVVSNLIQLRPSAENTTRLGLSNIINRYKLLTDKEVYVLSNAYFTIKIPLLT